MDSLLVVVMVIALVLAVAMSVFAWRVLRRDRERADVRLARLRSLASDAGPVPDLPDIPVEVPTAPTRFSPPPELFTPHATGPRWGRAIVVVAGFMAIGAATVYGLYTADAPLSWPTRAASTTVAPLELLSLTHRRETNGEFVVTGLVQNPDGAPTTPALQAVVYLFDAGGQYFTSATARLEVSTLPPGDVSPFTIRITGAGKVGRYRLGFRREDGPTFAHVDRRGEPLAGTTTATVEEGK